MILMITSQGATLKSKPNQIYGRSLMFIKYETENDKWEAFMNPGVNEPGGASIAASQFVIDQHASAVISGNFGPNAFRLLEAAGIQMWTFDKSYESIEDVVEAYRNKKLTPFIHPRRK
jgi:predicted Fe-Mo cluster-binding NifX family protein